MVKNLLHPEQQRSVCVCALPGWHLCHTESRSRALSNELGPWPHEVALSQGFVVRVSGYLATPMPFFLKEPGTEYYQR